MLKLKTVEGWIKLTKLILKLMWLLEYSKLHSAQQSSAHKNIFICLCSKQKSC